MKKIIIKNNIKNGHGNIIIQSGTRILREDYEINSDETATVNYHGFKTTINANDYSEITHYRVPVILKVLKDVVRSSVDLDLKKGQVIEGAFDVKAGCFYTRTDFGLYHFSEEEATPIPVYMKEKSPEKEKPTAQQRKETPVYSGVLKYFPNAIKEVAKTSFVGNEQHHPGAPLHWDMSKSADEQDALVRHLIDHTIDPMDDDGVLHLAKVAWRALAGLERYLTNKEH